MTSHDTVAAARMLTKDRAFRDLCDAIAERSPYPPGYTSSEDHVNHMAHGCHQLCLNLPAIIRSIAAIGIESDVEPPQEDTIDSMFIDSQRMSAQSRFQPTTE